MGKGMNWDRGRHSGKQFEQAFPTSALWTRRSPGTHGHTRSKGAKGRVSREPLTQKQIAYARALARKGVHTHAIAMMFRRPVEMIRDALANPGPCVAATDCSSSPCEPRTGRTSRAEHRPKP